MLVSLGIDHRKATQHEIRLGQNGLVRNIRRKCKQLVGARSVDVRGENIGDRRRADLGVQGLLEHLHTALVACTDIGETLEYALRLGRELVFHRTLHDFGILLG